MNFPHDHQQQYPRQPTTSFVLIRTHQVGIVARYTKRAQRFNYTVLVLNLMVTNLQVFRWMTGFDKTKQFFSLPEAFSPGCAIKIRISCIQKEQSSELKF